MSSEMKQETRPDMIACENVDKWFGDFQALKGVTATIAEQEVVVVLGATLTGYERGCLKLSLLCSTSFNPNGILKLFCCKALLFV